MLKRVAVTIPTAHRTDFIDLTPLLEDAVAKSGVREGIAHVMVRHTSCSLAIQEWEPNLIHDFQTFLGQFATDDPETPTWLHNQVWRRPDVPPDEPRNADAHIKALFMGNSRAVPVVGAKLDLGRWQRVILVEMDGPREREVVFMVQGDAVQDGLRQYWQEQAKVIEAAIEPYLLSRFEGPVLEGSRYLTKGGKRLRGVLVLLICEVLGGDPDRALDAAVAVEMVHAGCMPASEKVLLATGEYRSIADVHVGETVLAFHDGDCLARPVTATYQTGRQSIFELQTTHRTIRATSNHQFLTISQHRTPYFSLSPGDRQTLQRLGRARFGSWRKAATALHVDERIAYGVGASTATLSRLGTELGFDHNGLHQSRDNRTTVKRSLAWKALSDLKVGDLIVVLKKAPDSGSSVALPEVKRNGGRGIAVGRVALPKTTSPDFCRLVGFYLADGHLGSRQLSLSGEQGPVRDYYEQLIEAVFSVKASYNKANPWAFVISSVEVCGLFRACGLAGVAKTKRLPSWVFRLPLDQKLALLSGYLDGDGYVTEYGAITVASRSRELLGSVKLLADASGFITSKVRSESHDGTPTYWLKFTGPSLNKLSLVKQCPQLRIDIGRYKDRLWPSKCPGLLDSNVWGLDTVMAVQSTGIEDTYDLTVQGAHSFIANNVVAHNSLVKDDLQDGDKLRRGNMAAWVVFGIRRATALVDVATPHALSMLQKYGKEAVYAALEAWKTIGLGQAKDLFVGSFKGQNVYDEIAREKTGVLFGLAASLGAISAGADAKTKRLAGAYGRKLGYTFQVIDDTSEHLAGKPVPASFTEWLAGVSPEDRLRSLMAEVNELALQFPAGPKRDYLMELPQMAMVEMLAEESRARPAPAPKAKRVRKPKAKQPKESASARSR